MGYRLKSLILVFVMTIMYSLYYWGLPVLLNLKATVPFISKFVKNEYGFNLEINNPKIKMGLMPSIWFSADEFKVLNDNKTNALYFNKPNLKLSLIPLIIGKVDIKYFNAKNVFVDLSCDKNLNFRLGQYLIIKSTNSIFKINGAKIFVDNYKLNFNDISANKSFVLLGKYFKLDKFIENKFIKFSTNSSIISSGITSNLNIDIDLKLPFQKHLDDYPPEISASITNLHLDEFSNLIKYATEGQIGSISGILNLDLHSDKKIIEQKQYNSVILLDKFAISSNYLDKPYYCNKKLELLSNLLIQRDSLSVPSIIFKTSDIAIKLSGTVDKISSKKPIPNLNLKMYNQRSEKLLELMPYCNRLEKMIKISYSVAKDAGFYSSVNVDLNISDNLNQPKLNGFVNIDDAYVIERIKKAPKGAFIGLSFVDDHIDLDVNVPTDTTQHVDVKGKINIFGEKDVDLHITSTNAIDLKVAKKVLMPVHKTLMFELGPVPVMEFSGFGNIDLTVKGNKKHPHTYGYFKTNNASAKFDEINNLLLTNAYATLIFDDYITRFSLQKGLLNDLPANIDGTCDLGGKFNFKVIANKQNLSNLLKIAKTSPMLKDLSKSLELIMASSGKVDFKLDLKGQVKNISELKLGTNVKASCTLNLLSNSVKIKGLPVLLSNISGLVNTEDFNVKMNLTSKLGTSEISILGLVKENVADINVKSDKVKISDFLKFAKLKDIKFIKTRDDDYSFAKFNATYKGSVTKIEKNKFKASGYAYLKNMNLIYTPVNAPIKAVSGYMFVKNDTINISKLNLLVASMPMLVDGKIENILKNPIFDMYISTKPNQKFIDVFYNKNSIYPIKIKGDITCSSLISGKNKRINSRTNLKLDKDASIYYMGAKIGDEFMPISLILDTIYEQNKINVKSFNYDKLVFSQNNKVSLTRQLTATGTIFYNKNDVIFKNFKIKTSIPTDTRIFNIVFKKPLIKKGQFTSDIIINGSIYNPYIRGLFDLTGMDIPFFDTAIKNISLNFMPKTIAIVMNGEVLSNHFEIKANAQNSLKPPYVINSGELNAGNFNVNNVLNSLKNYEIESIKGSSTPAQSLFNFNINQIIIHNFKILAKNVNVNNINAKDLNANLKLKNNNLEIDKFKFILAHGQMEGSVSHNTKTKDSHFDLIVSGANADVLMTSLFDLHGQIYGNLDGNLNLSCKGESHLACMKSLNGYGAFQVKDGRMPKLGSLEYLLKAGNLLKSGITGLSINGIIDLTTPLKTGNFDSIKGSVSIVNGIADNIQILSKGRDLNLFISGIYNFSTYYADMYVFGRLSKKISNMLGPVGNASLNTLFSTIPGVNLSDPSNATILNEINKIPGLELSNKLYRIFAVEVHGDISGEDYVESFRWVE